MGTSTRTSIAVGPPMTASPHGLRGLQRPAGGGQPHLLPAAQLRRGHGAHRRGARTRPSGAWASPTRSSISDTRRRARMPTTSFVIADENGQHPRLHVHGRVRLRTLGLGEYTVHGFSHLGAIDSTTFMPGLPVFRPRRRIRAACSPAKRSTCPFCLRPERAVHDLFFSEYVDGTGWARASRSTTRAARPRPTSVSTPSRPTTTAARAQP